MSLQEPFQFMALALFTAYRALRRDETPVACVLVHDDGSVVAYGYNGTNDTLNGTRHAEFIAADKALRRLPRAQWGDPAAVGALFGRITVYVTVEPCIMCASALKQLGVKKVVYGCGNDRFGGNGTVLSVHQDTTSGTPYPSFGGVLRTEAVQLLRNFYIQENSTAPQPKIKKNRQLDAKPYPPNLDFATLYGPKEFESFYGKARSGFHHDALDIEVTPEPGAGYSVRDLVSAEQAARIPGIEGLYETFSPAVLADDLESFYQLFYDISADGTVSFAKEIATVDTLAAKRRKVDPSSNPEPKPTP